MLTSCLRRVERLTLTSGSPPALPQLMATPPALCGDDANSSDLARLMFGAVDRSDRFGSVTTALLTWVFTGTGNRSSVGGWMSRPGRRS
jgi:hypothetical protein